MALGPGKYDDMATLVRKQTGGGVLLIVLNGRLGGGFSAQVTPVEFMAIPRILRDVADEIERTGGRA